MMMGTCTFHADSRLDVPVPRMPGVSRSFLQWKQSDVLPFILATMHLDFVTTKRALLFAWATCCVLQEVHYDFAVRGLWTAQGTSQKKLDAILALIFSNLSETAKQIFLDCVTVMEWVGGDDALSIWQVLWGDQGGVVSAFQELQQCALVSVDDVFGVETHDIISKLGRATILDRHSPFYGSRAWVKRGKLVQFDKPVVAITFLGLDARLAADAEYIRQFIEQSAFDQLHTMMRGGGLVSGGEQPALLELALKRTTTLRVLDLSRCEQLRHLPRSLGHLTALQVLNLSDCEQLRYLPKDFGQLAALQKLYLSNCRQLQRLPNSFKLLKALQILDLSGCCQLQSLPRSFGDLTALQELDLSHCQRLESLPESFSQLTALEYLDISFGEKLKLLPESFGGLIALKKLSLAWCEQLVSLPDSFGQLKALHTLNLSNCSQLGRLPETFQQLTALRLLSLDGCNRLVVPLKLSKEFTGQLTVYGRLSNNVELPPELQHRQYVCFFCGKDPQRWPCDICTAYTENDGSNLGSSNGSITRLLDELEAEESFESFAVLLNQHNEPLGEEC
eukprot:GHUV01032515.1.p1 GENE.GHUV01032515.1~~GHUV01032515.1.p1  ORF type:complete len:562 (+),score=108.74 GHUV01032515.1:738-2423(+)